MKLLCVMETESRTERLQVPEKASTWSSYADVNLKPLSKSSIFFGVLGFFSVPPVENNQRRRLPLPPRIDPSTPRMISRPIWEPMARAALLATVVRTESLWRPRVL